MHALHTLKLSVSLPDDTHPDMEIRVSSEDASCDVVIAVPTHANARLQTASDRDVSLSVIDPAGDVVIALPTRTLAGAPVAHVAEVPGDPAANRTADDYDLGGYAGI